jgi:VWFA-related protein
LRRILRDAKPIPSLGPGIFESVLFVVPGSVGCVRARILLPRAWRDWDAVKLRAVLAHERAHIRRWDWLIRVASHVNVCIFWFHPLAWWMEREIARLAEEACDDVALSELDDREEYAATLVDMARAAAAGGDGRLLNWGVISMARDSNVIRRVNRILDARLQVPKPLGRHAWVTLFACSLPVIYLSAAVKLAKLAPANRDSTVLERTAVPARPAEEARQALLQEQKSPEQARLIAQAAPNQPRGPGPPPTPMPREDPPITMCILIDNSGSMFNKREGVKAAALALVKASKPRDEVCIVDFNDEAINGLPHGEDFTSDIREMEEALTHIESRGGKAMRDAVRMSIDHVQQTAHSDRKVIVLVTEGNDTASAVSREQLLSEVRNSGVRVYCIGLVSEDDPRQAGAAKLALGQLAAASGGLDYYPRDLAEVESIAPEIAIEVRKR